VLTPLERREFDFSDLDRWMREADQAIRRTKAVLDRLAVQPSPPASDGACLWLKVQHAFIARNLS
jgi:hypothetical protein